MARGNEGKPETGSDGAIVKQTRPKSPMMTLGDFLKGPEVSRRLAQVAKDFMTPEDLVRMALVAIHRSPKILECSRESILAALMDAAELKIRPGGMMGRGYLIPRMNKNTRVLECTFDPGWRGLIDIMRRSGDMRNIEAHVVRLGDRIELVQGTEPKLIHVPILNSDAKDRPIIGAYAIAWFKGGDQSYQLEYLTREDLNKIRNASMAKSGPWADWEDEMSRKSAVRRLSKYMPYSSDLEKARKLAAKADDEDGTIDVEAFEINTDVTVTDDGEVVASGNEAAKLEEATAGTIASETARAGMAQQGETVGAGAKAEG